MTDSVSGEGLLSQRWCLLTESSQGGRGKLALWGPFYKGTDPIYDDLITSQRPLLLTPSPLGLGFLHMNFEGHKHSDHSTTPPWMLWPESSYQLFFLALESLLAATSVSGLGYSAT